MKRIPVIKQLTATGCGAACLAMMAKSLGIKLSYAEAAEVCSPGRDGVNALTILKGAQQLGMRGRGLRVEVDSFDALELPVILHWGFNHFVVLEKWNGTKGTIVDPNHGRRRVDWEEVDSKFTGVAITLERSGIPPAHLFKESATNTWKHHLIASLKTKGVRSRLWQVFFASLFLAFVGFFIPFSTKTIINKIIPSYDSQPVLILVAITVLLLLAYFSITLLRGFLLVWLQGKLTAQMTLSFFEHTLSLPFRFFQVRGSGDLMVRLTSNNTIQNIITQGMVGSFLDILLVLVYTAVLFSWSMEFSIVVITICMILATVALLSLKPTHRLLQKDLEAQSVSEGFLVESLTAIETLKATGTENSAFNRWSDLFFTQLNISLKRGRLEAIVYSIISTISTLAPLILLLFGVLLVLENKLDLGEMLAAQGLAVLMFAPVTRIVSQIQQIQLAFAHLERISDVLESTPEKNEFGNTIIEDYDGSICFRDVSFKYSPSDRNILQNINVDIPSGSKVALVGSTGSGKSTFAKLLQGLLKPTDGTIFYGNVPQSSIAIEQLRKNFGSVIQSASIFSGSIRQNIAFTDPEVPMEYVITAAKKACIHEDIVAMPMQYETIISESGSVLSGGQRQRIALARALISNPCLLVLDEATSHLDAVTEANVMKNLDSIKATKVVSAHRLSTIVDSDLILVFKDGKIIERGSHRHLLSLGGHYSELIKKQLAEN